MAEKNTAPKPSMNDEALAAATPAPARAEAAGYPKNFSPTDRPERISEGVRAELEVHGEATDPTTGRRIVGTGVDDARYAK